MMQANITFNSNDGYMLQPNEGFSNMRAGGDAEGYSFMNSQFHLATPLPNPIGI